MKNTLKDNPYLENIIKSIDKNLKWIGDHPGADRVGMLKYVVKHCYKRIEEMENENDNHMGSGTS